MLSNSLESFIQLIGVLLIFVFVLAITYFTTKWMGGFAKVHSHNKNLRIVENLGMGGNKMISIVAAGTRYLVVAVGKDEITLLAELTEEELSEMPDLSQPKSVDSFQEILEKMKKKLPRK
mgnify:CR=1 FL=1